jgi:hypothetical protein
MSCWTRPIGEGAAGVSFTILNAQRNGENENNVDAFGIVKDTGAAVMKVKKRKYHDSLYPIVG